MEKYDLLIDRLTTGNIKDRQINKKYKRKFRVYTIMAK